MSDSKREGFGEDSQLSPYEADLQPADSDSAPDVADFMAPPAAESDYVPTPRIDEPASSTFSGFKPPAWAADSGAGPAVAWTSPVAREPDQAPEPAPQPEPAPRPAPAPEPIPAAEREPAPEPKTAPEPTPEPEPLPTDTTVRRMSVLRGSSAPTPPEPAAAPVTAPPAVPSFPADAEPTTAPTPRAADPAFGVGGLIEAEEPESTWEAEAPTLAWAPDKRAIPWYEDPADPSITALTNPRVEGGALEAIEYEAVPSRAAAHLLGILAMVLLIPVAWYLISDAGARMTLPANAPWQTGVPNVQAILELLAGLALVVIAFLFARASSLGALIAGSLITIFGLTFVVAPGYTKAALAPIQESLRAMHAGLGGNIAHHLEADGSAGRFVTLGVVLTMVGIVSHGARRRGRYLERVESAAERHRIRAERHAAP